MGIFRYPIEIAATPQGPFEALEAVADTGSTYLWVPRPILERLGVPSLEARQFVLASGETVELDVGQVVVRIDGRAMFTICVFGPEGSQALLGAYTLEGLGLAADPVGKRLIRVPGYAL